MHLINISQDAADALIAAVAQHVPAGTGLGRLSIAQPSGILAEDDAGTTSLYGLEDDDGGCFRLAELDACTYELVKWYRGRERSREIVRRDPPDESNHG